MPSKTAIACAAWLRHGPQKQRLHRRSLWVWLMALYFCSIVFESSLVRFLLVSQQNGLLLITTNITCYIINVGFCQNVHTLSFCTPYGSAAKVDWSRSCSGGQRTCARTTVVASSAVPISKVSILKKKIEHSFGPGKHEEGACLYMNWKFQLFKVQNVFYYF